MQELDDLTSIEWCAKALGMWNKTYNCYYGRPSFNPLENWNDAMLLVVQLQLTIVVESDMQFVRTRSSDRIFSTYTTSNSTENERLLRKIIVQAGVYAGKHKEKYGSV